MLASSYALTPPFDRQAGFITSSVDPARQTVAAFSGLQGGKTLCGADAVRELLYGPKPMMLPRHLRGKMPMEVWILSKSYALVDTAVATLRYRTPPDIWLDEKECRSHGLKRHDSRTWWLAPRAGCEDGLPVLLRARTASDPEALRATPTLGLAWCDEIAHWKELAWKNLQGRAIVAKTKFLITTTPKGKNWLYRDVYVPGKNGADPTIAIHEWRSMDNPYADQEYLQKLRFKFGPQYAEQELDAMFTSNVGYVYDFDRTVHMRPLPSQNPDDYGTRILGVDPGYSDPYAVGVWLRDSAGVWWLAEEFYQTHRTSEELVPWFQRVCTRWKIKDAFVDKRRPADYLLLRNAGVPARPNVDIYAEDDRRTVMPMVRMMQQLFRQNKVFFSPECEWHAEEAENYAFPDRDDRNAGENPVDFRNHAMDAMRYAICSVEGMYQGPLQFRRHPVRPNEMVPWNRGQRKPGERRKMPTIQESLLFQDKQQDELGKAR